MSVSGQVTSVQYTSNGVTTVYSIPFYFFLTTDIVVELTATNGTVTTAVNGTAYIVSGIQDTFGAFPFPGASAIITFQPGNIPANGVVITIIRQTAQIQTTTWVDNQPFPATNLEHALDRLTLMVQELLGNFQGNFLGLMAGPPTSGNYNQGNWFLVTPFVAGGTFAYVCTASGAPGTWNAVGDISL